jgi:hypothetical protein
MSNIYQPEETQRFSTIESLDRSTDSLETTAPSPPPPAGTARKKHTGRRLRPWIIICACLALVLLPTVVYGLSLYQEYSTQYHQDLALAQAGVQDLQSAETVLKEASQGSLDQARIMQAHQHFSTALTDFSQLQNNLAQLPGIASSIPRYGSLLASAQRIIPLAIDVSQAGITGTDALNLVLPHLRGVVSSRAQGLSMQDITTITQDVAQIQTLLASATAQINQLQPADLRIDARMGRAVATFRADLPAIQSSLQSLRQALAIAPTLLGIGTPASYLIEQLDSTEVRPGGGFIGSYGLATFSDGRLTGLHLADTYLLDIPYTSSGHVIPFPAGDSWFPLAPSWSLRDSNLEPDFPTNARYAEQMYHTEGGTTALQGVIAITPMFIQDALEITGPIYVSQYNETITAQNLINRIHYHQLKEELAGGDTPSPDGISSLRKHFTAVLFEDFFARVRQIASADMQKFQTLLLNALRTKDIQVYLNSNPAEQLLQNYHLSSNVQAPAGDTLMVVDANIISNKANYFITYSINDRVTIDASGNAVHATTLTYNWPYTQVSTQNNYGGVTTAYTDYLRVYAPRGSLLQAQSGWIPQGTGQAYGLTTWAGIFHLQYGHSGSVALTWSVKGAAIQDSHGWHYTYLIQRQAGIAWKLHLQVILPSCAHTSTNSGAAPLTKSGTLSQYVTTNMHVGENYLCS